MSLRKEEERVEAPTDVGVSLLPSLAALQLHTPAPPHAFDEDAAPIEIRIAPPRQGKDRQTQLTDLRRIGTTPSADFATHQTLRADGRWRPGTEPAFEEPFSDDPVTGNVPVGWNSDNTHFRRGDWWEWMYTGEMRTVLDEKGRRAVNPNNYPFVENERAHRDRPEVYIRGRAAKVSARSSVREFQTWLRDEFIMKKFNPLVGETRDAFKLQMAPGADNLDRLFAAQCTDFDALDTLLRDVKRRRKEIVLARRQQRDARDYDFRRRTFLPIPMLPFDGPFVSVTPDGITSCNAMPRLGYMPDRNVDTLGQKPLDYINFLSWLRWTGAAAGGDIPYNAHSFELVAGTTTWNMMHAHDQHLRQAGQTTFVTVQQRVVQEVMAEWQRVNQRGASPAVAGGIDDPNARPALDDLTAAVPVVNLIDGQNAFRPNNPPDDPVGGQADDVRERGTNHLLDALSNSRRDVPCKITPQPNTGVLTRPQYDHNWNALNAGNGFMRGAVPIAANFTPTRWPGKIKPERNDAGNAYADAEGQVETAVDAERGLRDQDTALRRQQMQARQQQIDNILNAPQGSPRHVDQRFRPQRLQDDPNACNPNELRRSWQRRRRKGPLGAPPSDPDELPPTSLGTAEPTMSPVAAFGEELGMQPTQPQARPEPAATGYPLEPGTTRCWERNNTYRNGNRVDITAAPRGIVVVTMKMDLFARCFLKFDRRWEARNTPDEDDNYPYIRGRYTSAADAGGPYGRPAPHGAQEWDDYQDFRVRINQLRLAGTRILFVLQNINLHNDRVLAGGGGVHYERVPIGGNRDERQGVACAPGKFYPSGSADAARPAGRPFKLVHELADSPGNFTPTDALLSQPGRTAGNPNALDNINPRRGGGQRDLDMDHLFTEEDDIMLTLVADLLENGGNDNQLADYHACSRDNNVLKRGGNAVDVNTFDNVMNLLAGPERGEAGTGDHELRGASLPCYSCYLVWMDAHFDPGYNARAQTVAERDDQLRAAEAATFTSAAEDAADAAAEAAAAAAPAAASKTARKAAPKAAPKPAPAPAPAPAQKTPEGWDDSDDDGNTATGRADDKPMVQGDSSEEED